ncbi:MAG: ankyrin repeat domain-containing protein, partial [Merdibacter sp.]|nr:ankyrin repeat domain-containing protein [Merdibacter sp.]
EAGRTALMEACVAFKKGVIRILLERGADVNLFDNNGCTALMRAAYGGYASLVEELLANGADKDMTDKEGNKAVHYVREHCLAQLKPILK